MYNFSMQWQAIENSLLFVTIGAMMFMYKVPIKINELN